MHNRRMSMQLKLARVARDWTQDELSEHSGVQQADISRMENGWSAPLELQQRLAKALDRTVEELFGQRLDIAS